MALTHVDQSELLTALYAPAAGEGDLFRLFLHRLCRRTGARGAGIVERRGLRWQTHAVGTRPAIDRDALMSVRPDRVYRAGDVGGDLDTDAAVDARLIRSHAAAADRWLIVTDSASGFDAADSALLSALAPHVAIAGEAYARCETLRHDLAAARAALGRAGVAWALLDAAGEIVAGDVSATPHDRATLARRISGGASAAVVDGTLGLPPPDDGPSHAAALALARIEAVPIDRVATFRALTGASVSEARLAIALADGASIAQAATTIGITVQTARFYSKRLYALTGTTGQADLVRFVWTTLTALS